MRLNPEIVKYIWQDFSLHRLIAAPLIVAALGLALYNFDPEFTIYLITESADNLIFAVLLIWGGYNAARSVRSEVANNSWDWQRLSPNSPLSITLGKLFGSTLYSWYCGLLLIITLTIIFYIKYPSIDSASWYSRIFSNHIPYIITIILLAAIICHCLALLTSIISFPERGKGGVGATIFFLIIALIIASIYRYSIFGLLLLEESFDKTGDPIPTWNSIAITSGWFIILSSITFILWMVIGITRILRKQLGYRNLPWVWFGFIVFMVCYFSVFNIDTSTHPSIGIVINNSLSAFSVKAHIGMFIALICAYIGVIADKPSITNYRIMWNNLRQKRYLDFFANIPLWFIAYLTALGSILFWIVKDGLYGIHGALFVSAVFLFVLRDMLVYHYFRFASNNRRALLATIFYILISYILCPIIGMLLLSSDGIAMFVPYISITGNADLPTISLISAAVQVIVIAVLLAMRWFKVTRKKVTN